MRRTDRKRPNVILPKHVVNRLSKVVSERVTVCVCVCVCVREVRGEIDRWRKWDRQKEREQISSLNECVRGCGCEYKISDYSGNGSRVLSSFLITQLELILTK